VRTSDELVETVSQHFAGASTCTTCIVGKYASTSGVLHEWSCTFVLLAFVCSLVQRKVDVTVVRLLTVMLAAVDCHGEGGRRLELAGKVEAVYPGRTPASVEISIERAVCQSGEVSCWGGERDPSLGKL
jgi:hypothetical protein